MRRVHGLTAATLVACGWMALATEAPADIKPPQLGPAPGVAGVPHPGLTRPPTLQLPGPCGLGQMQCYLGGGVVPAKMTSTVPDAARPKVCVAIGDPKWGCGTCTRNILWKVEGAYCSPKGNTPNYTTCSPNWEDRDGNRSNGCETWVPTKHADGWQRPAPTPVPAGPCALDDHVSRCGSSPDIRCVLPGNGSYVGTCQWFACDLSQRRVSLDGRAVDLCSYVTQLDTGIATQGVPACLGVGAPGADSHGCGWTFPKCPPFETPKLMEPGHCYMEDPRLFDVDGDGQATNKWVDAHGNPIGTDCDDGDPTRFPGNPEVCDAFGHDEDCDPSTNGARDADGDGLLDAACCNTTNTGARLCGTDCDDHNPGLALSGKRCLPSGEMQICTVDTSNGGRVASWVTRACGPGSTCVPQPDGTGVCQIH